MPDHAPTPVVCPQCGCPFAFDSTRETAVTPPNPAARGASVVYRPACPRCRRRVAVEVPAGPAGPPGDTTGDTAIG